MNEVNTGQQTMDMIQKKRVAAYCRVSTDSDGQKNSFETQVKIYRDRIDGNREWINAGIYADEGISGTSILKRGEFRRMLQDCGAGKIDMIITKSISRFARNTVECLSCIRQLQEYGVQIYFEKENIDTGTAFSEMLLTILAAFAQEESRSLSENVKWGIRKRYEEGMDRWVRIYGYTCTAEERYLVVPGQARVIRRIFALYEQGMSMSGIAAALMRENVLTPSGKKYWDSALVNSILENEKYAGDILLQKMYTIDHLSHRIVKNKGEVPSYYLKNHHTAIVSEKTFQRVNAIREMKRRCDSEGKGKQVQYPFADKLRCPRCGSPLYQRKLYIQEGKKGWSCEVGEEACRRFLIRSYFVESAVLKAYEDVDLEEVRKKVCSPDMRLAEAAEIMLCMKRERNTFQKVDYYWVDELVDTIRFGRHTGEEDRTLEVYWRCGVKTIVDSGICKDKDNPEYVAALYHSWRKRKEKNEK